VPARELRDTIVAVGQKVPPLPAMLIPGLQVKVITGGVVRMVADPGQLGQPDAGRGEHRDDGGIPACANVLPRQTCSSSDSSTLVKTGDLRHSDLRCAGPGHRVGELFLGGPPLEELPQRRNWMPAYAPL
jgi:hypothetical protein